MLTAAALVVLAAHAAGTWQRNIIWRTEESLWLDVTERSPKNGRGLMTYGVIQMQRGNLAKAEEYYNRALQYTPRYAYLHVNIGVLKGAQGKREDAEHHFREAQRYDARNPVAYYYYARWLASIGRTEEATVLARTALELSPAHVEAKELLDSLTATRLTTPEQWLERSLRQYQGRFFDDSIASSREALKLRPDYAEAFNNICAAENQLGRYAEAITDCERAIAIKPDFPLARNNLATRATGIIARGEARGLPAGAERVRHHRGDARFHSRQYPRHHVADEDRGRRRVDGWDGRYRAAPWRGSGASRAQSRHRPRLHVRRADLDRLGRRHHRQHRRRRAVRRDQHLLN